MGFARAVLLLARSVMLLGCLLCAAPSWASIASVASVAATTGYYDAGQVIPITVTFSEAVNVSGSPALTLSDGANVVCTPNTGSTTTLTCSYTVTAGQNANPLNVTALAGNYDTVSNPGNPATTVGITTMLGTSNVVIDTTAPTLPAANIRASNQSSPNTLQLTFSEAMKANAALTLPATYTVKNHAGTITYSIASVAITSPTIVTLTLAAPLSSNTATYFTNADIAAHLQVTLASGLTDLAGNALVATTVTESGAAPLTDVTVPTLPAANIQANNSVQPNTVTLTFSKAMAAVAALTNTATYTVTNNAAAISYTVASAAQTANNIVTLTLATPDPTNTKTYMTNADIGAHLKVTLANGLTDLPGNALVAATVTEAGAAPVTEATHPTAVPTLTLVDTTHVKISFSTKMNLTSATTLTNYTLSGSGGAASLSGNPSAAVLASNGTDVTLTVPTLSNLHPGDTVTVTAGVALQDLAGNSLSAPGAATLTASNAPTGFAFTAATNALLKTVVVSNIVTIAGINVPSTISVAPGSDASLQCATAPLATGVWGAFASCAGLVVNNGDQIKVELTSAPTGNSVVTGGIVLGGVTATFSVTTSATASVPGTITYTALTTLTGVLNAPDPAIYISSNGVMVIPSTTAAPVTFLPSAPAGTAVLVRAGANAQVTIGGVTMTMAPINGDVLFITKNYSIDSVANLPVLELAQGRISITYSGVAAPVTSLQLGTGSTAKQMLVYASLTPPAVAGHREVVDTVTNPAGMTADVQITSTGGAIVAITSGLAGLRLDSSASTVALTDLPTYVYAAEVATVAANGTVSNIRVGSIDGLGGLVGDAVATSYPAGVTTLSKTPNLSLPLARLSTAPTLLQGLFNYIGSITTLQQNTQIHWGEIPLLYNNIPLYVVPYGDVQVDTTRADGTILLPDGHFEVTRKGVYVKVNTMVYDLSAFAQAVSASYGGGTVQLTVDGAYQIDNGGQTLLVKPNLTAVAGTANTPTIVTTANGQLSFNGPAFNQLLYPHFYDLTQLASVFAFLDPKMTLTDNLDGTVTAVVKGQSYTLVPQYQILSPIGGVPPQHRNDAWWSDNSGVLYFKYSTGAAQGFTVH
ncbi:MAG: hypothetical protein JO218_17515 [Burkholderiales bacterium]|nr:hypothetical protein [Burkholderiales bacterium]